MSNGDVWLARWRCGVALTPNRNPNQVWWRGLVGSEAGYIASACLGLFHGGAVCAFLWAWRCGAIPLSKVLLPHAPFAAAFLWHCSFSLARNSKL